jgi:hypothetical protein
MNVKKEGKSTFGQSFIKEPLVHFLFAGLCLFLIYRLSGYPYNDMKIINVDEEAVMDYMQYQSNTFNREVFKAQFLELSKVDKENLVDRFLKDEVLYRRAISLGLDQSDYVIKRRIIQKMEFLLDDFDASKIIINEESLKAFYIKNRERYSSPAYVSFSHIFFKGVEAESKASDFLKSTLSRDITIDKSLSLGDRFMYQRNYVEKNKEFIASQFGETFAKIVFLDDFEKDTWVGPVKSAHGYHLVHMIDFSPATIKTFDEVKPLAKEDYLVYLKRLYLEQKTEKLKKDFVIKINLD